MYVSATSRVLLGIEANHNHKALFRGGDEEYGLYASYDVPFTILSAYAQNELHISSRVSVTVGARIDDYSDLETAVSPRAALVAHPTEATTLKLLYGEAFRAPSRWEAHYEEEDYQKTNPNLSPQTIKTTELVLEHRLATGILGTVSVYDYSMCDLIDETVDPADDLVLYDNVSSVSARGLEVGLRGRFSSGIGGYASYVIQKGRDADDLPLSNAPARLFRAGVHMPVRSMGSAALEVQHDSERNTVWDTTTDSYTLAHLTLSTRKLFRGVRAQLSIRNLLDTSYQTPGGWEHAQLGIPQLGRTFRLTASMGL